MKQAEIARGSAWKAAAIDEFSQRNKHPLPTRVCDR